MVRPTQDDEHRRTPPPRGTQDSQGHREEWMAAARGGEADGEAECLKGTVWVWGLEEFWRWMVEMSAQECECSYP